MVSVFAVICILFITIICNGCSKSSGRSDEKKNQECANDFYTIEFNDNTTLDEGEFKVLCPGIQFERENNQLEEKINDILHQASTSWINKAFIKNSKNTCRTNIFCHTSRILSVGQSYETYEFVTNNYITVDLMTGEQIFLDDIITDIDGLAQILHEGEIMTASRNAFTLDQDEADAAVRESLRKSDLSQIKEMLRQCSLDQKQFPLPVDKKETKLPFVYERPNFYLQGEELVIEEGKWHSKIIVKYKDIDSLLESKYKEYLVAVP